ncbi:hypothetical protein [Thermococcus sp.]|uniref:hypothetical protein n=1 Tax=Thermococcus sp. TaxID=35749 RepID=UPI0025D70F8D|nr:hypothetical protein [Thermococcus sp.]
MSGSKALAILFLTLLLLGSVPVMGSIEIQPSELPSYFPTPGQLQGIGVTLISAEKDALALANGSPVPNSYGLSGKATSSVPNMEVNLIIARLNSTDEARALFRDLAGKLSQLYMLYQMKNNTDGVDYLTGVSSETSYGFVAFSTGTYDASDGKTYRINPSVAYFSVHLRGNFVVMISAGGGWEDVKLWEDPGYTIAVCSNDTAVVVEASGEKCDRVDSTKPEGYYERVIDGERYSAYLQTVLQRREMAVSEVQRVHDALMGLAFASVDMASSGDAYRVSITSPYSGQRFTSSSGFGLFVINVKARFSGDAKNPYAVITSPDGSRSRARVYSDGTIEDLVIVENTGLSEPQKGTVKVEVYGTVDSKETLLASGSVEITLANDEEKPGDMIDNDGDGLVDCDDPDIATCDECVYQKKLEWAESIMKRHIDYLEKVKSLHPSYASLYNVYEDDLREIHDRDIKDPDKMVEEMNAYMDRKVYGQQRIRALLSIFANDPEKRYQLRQIAEKYRYDPVARDVEMENFIYKYAKDEAEKAAITNLILTGVLQPPKWLVGGQYNSGGVLDWSKFVADNFEKVGDAVRLKGTEKVKFFTTPAGVYMVALDAKALLDHANDLKNMNLPNNAKVSIIVLDGATKIGKLLDPTGYFGNMADATVGALINLRKKIEERNQGWFTWNGYVLHETAIPGIYEDYETGKKFKRVGGGWLNMNFVEVEDNG